MSESKLVIKIEDDKAATPPTSPPAPATTAEPAAAAPSPPATEPAGSLPPPRPAGSLPAEPERRPTREFERLAENPDEGVSAYGKARDAGGDRNEGLAALVAVWEAAAKKATPAGTMPQPMPAGSFPAAPAASPRATGSASAAGASGQAIPVASTTATGPAAAPNTPKGPAGSTSVSIQSGTATAARAAGTAPPPAPGSAVPIFDRPTPVVIVGPNPLPVTMTGQAGNMPQPKPGPQPEKGGAWLARQLGQAGYVGERIGDAATGIAGNNAAPAVGAAVEAASAGLSKLGPYGMAAGVALQSVAKVGTAASETVDVFVKRGRELSSLNGQLAGASAMADLRSLMADIREADDLGPQMAEMIQMQSQTEAVFREIMSPVKSFLMDECKDFMVGLMIVVTGGLEGFNKLLAKLDLESDAIKKALARIKDILTEKDVRGDPMEVWRKAAEGLVPVPVAPAPAGAILGVPLLKRGR